MHWRVIFSLLILSTTLSGICQNWECIHHEYTCFYTMDYSYPQGGDSWIRAFKVDSIISVNGDQILYTQNEIINRSPDSIAGCYDPYGPSWLGDVVKSQNGDYYFTNDIYANDLLFNTCRNIHDTILIKSQAQIGDSWYFYHVDSLGLFIVATVISEDTLSFIGISDSVKYIQVYPENGPSFILILSKNYGFIKGLDFRNFDPGIYYYSPVSKYEIYSLSGIKELGLGKELITRGQIFDYNISDEFHSTVRYDDYWGNLLAYCYDIRIVIDKWFSPVHDTVYYLIERTNWCYSATGSTYNQDTLIDKYFDLGQYIPGTGAVPFECFFYDSLSIGYYRMFIGYGGRQVAEDRSEFYYSEPGDSCYYDMIWLKSDNRSPEYIYNTYIEGCGSYATNIDPEIWSCHYCESLNYYKKGNSEWGNPLIPPVGTGEEKFTFVDVKVFPVPSKDFITVQINAEKDWFPVQISLLDCCGRELYNLRTDQPSVRIPLKGLPQGIYFLHICSEDEGSRIYKISVAN
jgi:hypothetical protein